MKTTTLQTRNISVQVKEKAEEYAKEMGFTSLQDVIRLFVNDLAKKKTQISVNWGERYDEDGIPYVSKEEQKDIEVELKELSEDDEYIDGGTFSL